MAYDLKIVNGTVVDGTGKPSFLGNVAVKNGQIVEVGACAGTADRVIDAEGAIVTPGFTDIHCHYDGQVSWDSDLAPSCFHGVTTFVMGNCGVGFAPVHAKDHDHLIQLMEGVEDIPGAALAEGLNWRWESFEEYMDALDAMPHTLDFAAQVTHDALRVYVMGERAIAQPNATEQDIETMRALTRRALKAGAVGFTTGRTDAHRAASGAATPASEANLRELQGIAEAFKGLNHGVIQAVSDFDMEVGPERFPAEFDVLESMLDHADGHAMSISLSQKDMAPDQWRWTIDRAVQANERGKKIRLQVAARAIGVMLGLQATFHPFIGFPSYKKIAHLPLPERVRIMKEPSFRAQMLTEKNDKVAGDGSPIPPLADRFLANVDRVLLRMFRLGERPNYEPTMEDSLYAEAYARNVPPLEALYDAMLANDGEELLYFPFNNYTEFSLDNVGEMLAHPLALAALSDGGAHVGTVCDASFPTFMLMHWARDRAKGRLSLERVVQKLTSETSTYMGFLDRGVLAPGKKADLNVIDFKNLSLRQPRMVQDLPAGGKRLLQDAVGYRATIVSGEIITADGVLTGNRPGRLVRLKD